MYSRFDSRTPLYVQVIQYFKGKIASGAIEPGEEMPSRRELASKFKINPNTVQRAFKEMEEQGLIYTEGNSPSKITKDEKIFYAVREELLERAVDDFIKAVKPIQIPLDELLDLIKKNYDVEE